MIDIELTILQKKYYRAIYDRNRAYLEYDGSTMAQLVSIVVGRSAGYVSGRRSCASAVTIRL